MNADHCSYLQKRFDVFKNQKLFEKMEFSTDRAKIAEWAPLVVNGRDESQPIAANYSAEGTDVDFGNLTCQMVQYLREKGVKMEFNRHVEDIKRESDGAWVLKTCNTENHEDHLTLRSRFVFLGAGGGALTLLQNPVFRKAKATAASLFPACSFATATLKPLPNTMPKCTVKLPLVRLLCPFRTWIPAT